MVPETASERAAAMRLVGTGDFSGAIGILRRLAEASDDPEDRLAVGRLAYLATDYTEAQAQLERAYREFQDRGQPRRATTAATGRRSTRHPPQLPDSEMRAALAGKYDSYPEVR